MNESTVAIPKAEYDKLVQNQAYLNLILETSNNDGYVSVDAVNAVKRLIGYPAPVRTADEGSSDES